MTKSIICAGFGGQGIMFMGKLLAYSAMRSGYKVTWISSYGAEARGGAAYCTVIISDSTIASPVIENPDICIVMNNPSFEKFKDRIKKRGILILNSSLIDNELNIRKDIKSIRIPMTDIAVSCGNIRVANMVGLGAFLLADEIFDLDFLFNTLEEFIPAHRKNFLDINKNALRKGYEFGRGNKG
ncbi:MAG: 2-oxoacid:ferredoxin oxidoreductase subunit gamma [Candidatus Omnitrophica bacterium]|nr:2-oxoacid:ferredoxin oxidoreductase subunit gamma [Candidatus Omnitrophota bacterium]